MKTKTPPMPSPMKMPNKSTMSSGKKVSSDKHATINGHLSGHEAMAKATSKKNMGC